MSDTPFSDAAAAAAMDPPAEEVEETAEEQEERAKKEFFADLKQRFGDEAPDEAMLNKWQAETGRVRWMEFGRKEIYFFRGCRSAEYKSWLNSLSTLGEKDPVKADEIFKEKLVTNCLLWPKIDIEDTAALFGGTIDTLYQQIRLASNFIPLELASSMVREW